MTLSTCKCLDLKKKNIFLNVHISFKGARKFAEGCFIGLKGVPKPSYL